MQIIIITLALLRFAVLALGLKRRDDGDNHIMARQNIFSWAGYNTYITNNVMNGNCLNELGTIGTTLQTTSGASEAIGAVPYPAGSTTTWVLIQKQIQDCFIYAGIVNLSGETTPSINEALIGNMIDGYSNAVSRGVMPNENNIGTLYLQGCPGWKTSANMLIDMGDDVFMVICIQQNI